MEKQNIESIVERLWIHHKWSNWCAEFKFTLGMQIKYVSWRLLACKYNKDFNINSSLLNTVLHFLKQVMKIISVKRDIGWCSSIVCYKVILMPQYTHQLALVWHNINIRWENARLTKLSIYRLAQRWMASLSTLGVTNVTRWVNSTLQVLLAQNLWKHFMQQRILVRKLKYQLKLCP